MFDTQRFKALEAVLGLNINDWMGSVGRFVASSDKMQKKWADGIAAMEKSTGFMTDSLGKMEHQLGLSGKELQDWNKQWKIYSDTIAEDAIRENERLAKSIEQTANEQQKWKDTIAGRAQTGDSRHMDQIEKSRAEALRHQAEAVKKLEDAERSREAARQRFISSGKAVEDATLRQIQNQRELLDTTQASTSAATKQAQGLAATAQMWDAIQQPVDEYVEAQRRLNMARRESIMGGSRLARMLAIEAIEEERAASAAAQHALALDALEEEARQAAAALSQTGDITKKNTMMVFEFGRAIEDAAVGFSLNGIRGMVMGASNNLARMAEMAGKAGGKLASFGPWAAVFVSIGAAVYTLWQNFSGTADATDKAKDEVEKYIEALDRLIERQQRIRQFRVDAMTATDSTQTEQMLASLDNDADELFGELQTLRGRRAQLQRDMSVWGTEESRAAEAAILAEVEQRIAEAENELTDLNVAQDRAHRQHLALLEEEAAKKAEIWRHEQELLLVEERRLALKQLQAEAEGEIARSMAAQQAAADMMAILDPDRAAVNDLMARSNERRAAIEADESLGSDMRQSMLADNEAAFNQEMEDLFGMDRFNELAEQIRDNLDAIPLGEMDQLLDQMDELRRQFDEGTISITDFTEGMDAVEQGLEDAAQAAEEAAEAAEEEAEALQRAALLRGDFAGAGLDMEQALEDRLAAERMRQWNQEVDRQFDSLMGVNKEMEKWEKQMREYAKEQERAMEALHEFQGDPQESIGALWAFINSLPGQIANTENTINLMQHTLDQLGDSIDVLRKKELEESIDNLTAALIDLYEQQRNQQFITEINGAAFVTDPGLNLPGGGNVSTTGRGGGEVQGGGAVLFSFPNVTQLSNTAISEVSDKLMEENRRRGVRTI